MEKEINSTIFCDSNRDICCPNLPKERSGETKARYSIPSGITKFNIAQPITWSVNQNLLDIGGQGGNLSSTDMLRVIRACLDIWKNQGDVTFNFVEQADLNTNVPNPDLTPSEPFTQPDTTYNLGSHAMIRFGVHKFDGPSGVLAHAYFPGDQVNNALVSDIHYDSAETWDLSKFYKTTLHELGHSLGLGHTNVNGAIMYPTLISGIWSLDNPTGNEVLKQDDINGIQALYLNTTPPNPGPTPGPSCLMAAGFEDQNDPALQTIRVFRDQILDKHPIGKVLIRMYYLIFGPKTAQFVKSGNTKKLIKTNVEKLAKFISFFLQVVDTLLAKSQK